MNKKPNEIILQILSFLKKTDKPVLSHHIAKSIKVRPQHVLYHLRNLIQKGIILSQKEFGHTYYYLQPMFYVEDAETTLMQLLLPWVTEFSKQTVIPEGSDEEQVRLENLKMYFQLFVTDIQKDYKKNKKF
jgi:DNA-binding transcriptional ArsR family regulator